MSGYYERVDKRFPAREFKLLSHFYPDYRLSPTDLHLQLVDWKYSNITAFLSKFHSYKWLGRSRGFYYLLTGGKNRIEFLHQNRPQSTEKPRREPC